MLAKDIMRKSLISANPHMTIREVAKLFIDSEISGAPVIDSDGKLLGVISQTDLIRHEREAPEKSSVPRYYRNDDAAALSSRGFHIEDPEFSRVENMMTPAVLSADESTSVEDLARRMLDNHIHRILITHGGKLCGIVTSMDMLRALLSKTAR